MDPKSLTLSCVNKSGTAHGLTQCPIKGDTPYFTKNKFWKLRRALQMQRKGQKTFLPQFWKQLYMTAIREGPDLRMAAKAVDTEHEAPPDRSKRSLPRLNAYVVKLLLGQGSMQMTLPRSNWTQSHLNAKTELNPMISRVLGLRPPHSVVSVDSSKQT